MHHHRKKLWLLTKGLIVAACLATAAMFVIWRYLLFSRWGFHHLQPAMRDLVAAALLLASLTAGFTIVFIGIRRLPAPWRSRVGIGFCSLVLLVGPFNEFRVVLADVLPQRIARSIFYITFPFLAVLLVLVRFRVTYRRTCRVLLIIVPFMVIVLGRLGWAMAQRPNGEARTIERHMGPHLALGNRVIWIIFDELDYRIGFQDRPESVKMPNFDQLAAASHRFTNASAPAFATMLSLPSLVDGVVYTNAYPAGLTSVLLRRPDGQLIKWGAGSNVFTDTRALGGRSAVVGWYLPYSRVFSNVVENATWYGFSPERFVGNGLSLAATMRTQFVNALPVLRRASHSDVVDGVGAAALRIVADPSYDFCFVHYPMPHLPGVAKLDFGERVHAVISDPISYLQNLAIADDFLGRCRKAIESTPAGSRTTLIVSSDHPWRTSAKYDGRSDPRVPFLVRFPGQKTGSDIGKAFQTVRTRDIVREILSSRELTGADSIQTLQGGDFR